MQIQSSLVKNIWKETKTTKWFNLNTSPIDRGKMKEMDPEP